MTTSDSADRINLFHRMHLHPDWTQEQLGQAVGRSKSWVYKWQKRLESVSAGDDGALHEIVQGQSHARKHPPERLDRWVVVRTQASLQRAQQTLQRQVGKAQATLEQKCWHFSNRRFACEADARAALERDLKGKPVWLEVQHDLVAHAQYAGKGRPRKDSSLTSHQWQVATAVTVNQEQVEQEALRKACWIVGTNVLDAVVLSDQQLVTAYKEQGGVERGFRFVKDPLFLASSVFVKKPERVMAALVSSWCFAC